MTEKTLEEVVEDAQQSFWASVVEHFPEITSGDFAPDQHINFLNACKTAVRQWVDNNKPILDRKEWDENIGMEIEVNPEDSHSFDGTLVGTKDDGNGGYYVQVKDEQDDVIDVPPHMAEL